MYSPAKWNKYTQHSYSFCAQSIGKELIGKLTLVCREYVQFPEWTSIDTVGCVSADDKIIMSLFSKKISRDCAST